MNHDIVHWLTESGLDEQRATVYLAVLERFECRASEIAQALGIGRTTIYDNLDYLERRGFVSKYKKGNFHVFKALQPHELEIRYKNHLTQLQELLPLFSTIAQSKSSLPTIQRFKGPFAARNIFEDILAKKPEEYCYISNPVETYKMVTRRYITRWIHRRVESKICCRGIRTLRLTDPGDRVFSEEKNFLRKLRYLPQGITFHATIYIYNDSVGLISSFREDEAMIINSPDISRTFQSFFEMIWRICKTK